MTNGETTLGATTSTANSNASVLDEIKNLVKPLVQKTNDQDKLTNSLSTKVETLTTRTRTLFPRGTPRARGKKKFDFLTLLNGLTNTQKNLLAQDSDKVTYVVTRENTEELRQCRNLILLPYDN